MNVINANAYEFVLTWKSVSKSEFMEILTQVKAMPGAKFREKDKVWTIPIANASVLSIVDIADRYGFVINHEARYAIEKASNQAIDLLDLSLGIKPVNDNFGLKKELWPFQKVGVQYGIIAGNHLNGDGPGTGKTAQAIGVIHAQNLYPVLVVTVKRNKIPFMRAWQSYTGMTSLSVWTNEARGNAQVDIIDYNMIDKLSDYIKKYRNYAAVVFDEIHYCKNLSTARSKACLAIAENIHYRYGYSGSLIVNHMRDLYAELKIIGREKIFGTEWDFLNAYCNVADKEIWKKNPAGGKAIKKTIKEFTGMKNEKTLFSTLRANCYIGRLRREVVADLPSLTVDYIDIPLEESEIAAEMKIYKRELIDIAEQMYDSKEGTLQYQSLEKQASGNIFKIRSAVGRAKLPGIKEWLMNFLESGEKIILFAHHQDVQSAVASWFPNGAIIKAGQSEIEAMNAVDKFTNDPECKTIVCSMMAGQEALNLQAASYMAILEQPWTQKDIDQMVGKMDRGEQRKAIMVYHLVQMEEGSVDQIIMEIRKLKADMGQINSTKYFINKFLKL